MQTANLRLLDYFCNRLEQRWRGISFARTARTILATPPLKPCGDSPIFVSMCSHKDVLPYLFAIKSLYLGVKQGRIVIINDASLTFDDIKLLRRHIPHVELVDIESIRTAPCPQGGTWERLLKIIELSNDNYVIQVDSDTLTLAPIPEVVNCWRENKPFLLGTASGQAILPVQYTAQMARRWIKENGWTSISVGLAAESSLDKLPGSERNSYVHASSGFAGFAHRGFNILDVQTFSMRMAEILGTERWSEWGSEQIASNYVLANAQKAVVLPFPRYACFEPQLPKHDYAFLHFIGTYRYNTGLYRRRAVDFVQNYEPLSNRV